MINNINYNYFMYSNHLKELRFPEEFVSATPAVQQLAKDLVDAKPSILVAKKPGITCRETLIGHLAIWWKGCSLLLDAGYFPVIRIESFGKYDMRAMEILEEQKKLDTFKATIRNMLATELLKLEVYRPDEDNNYLDRVLLTYLANKNVSQVRLSAVLEVIRLLPIFYEVDPSLAFLNGLGGKKIANFILENIDKLSALCSKHEFDSCRKGDLLYFAIYISSSPGGTPFWNDNSTGPMSHARNWTKERYYNIITDSFSRAQREKLAEILLDDKTGGYSPNPNLEYTFKKFKEEGLL